MPSASHQARATSTMPRSKTASISISGMAALPRVGRVVGVDDAVDAGDQALQGGAVELVGAAEAVHHPRFGALGLGVPDVFGEGVVGDSGAVAVAPLGDA